MLRVAEILIRLVSETLRWLRLSVRSTKSIKAENLFLRRPYRLASDRARPDRSDRIGLECPFIYFLLIDFVDSIHYVGIRKNTRRRRRFKNLPTKKMGGMLMSDVDNR
jgi:hypothetical protein